MVVLYPGSVIDTVTRQTLPGIHHVVLNGQLAVENGEWPGTRGEKVLRRPHD